MKFVCSLRSVFVALAWLALGCSLARAQATLPRAQVGVAYTFQVTTTPAAAAGTVYGATGLPTGLSINPTSGQIAGTPTTAGTANGVISLTSGGITNNFNYSLIVDPALGTPEITSAATASATVGTAFAYTVTANPTATSFNVGSLPPGLVFTSPQITGTPTAQGTYQIQLSANNATGVGRAATLTLTVAPSGPVPAITSATTATAPTGTPFTYAITTDIAAVAFTAVGLPLGLSLNATTGAISGTPTVSGVYTVTLSARNNNGTGPTRSLALTVGALSTISSAGTLALTVSQPMAAFALTATNAPQSFNVTGLPPGLTVNTATGAITGTPTTQGNFTVTASANNASGTGPNSTLTITVSAASVTPPVTPPGGGPGVPVITPPVITAQPSAQSAVEGTAVSFSVSAAGTGPLAFQWRKDGAAISGATVDTLRFASVAAADAGSYTVTVTNTAGAVTSVPAGLTVTALVTPPTILTAPVAQSVAIGANATFTVLAGGTGPLSYQWRKDGNVISGATAATLVISAATPADVGQYTVVVTNALGSITSVSAALNIEAPAVRTARLINLSTRGVVGVGERMLIAGFVVQGNAPKPVLIRAVGPTLGTFGLTGTLADPVLDLYSGNTLTATNDNWGASVEAAAIAATAARVGAFTLPVTSADAVILTTLPPGNYTAQVRGAAAATGVGIVEIYDATDGASASRLINVATRGEVGTGANILIAGFVVQGDEPKRVLLRAAGPALAALGVSGALGDPRLQLYAGSALRDENDNWSTPMGAGAPSAQVISAAAASAGAFAFASGSRDAAMVVTLPPGNYSAQVSGVSGATGVALVEVYELPRAAVTNLVETAHHE